MEHRAARIAAVAVSAAACMAMVRTIAIATPCPVSAGQAVVLASQELDPDVFLWDSRAGLVSYAAGDDDVRTVLRHTRLVRAFTDAVVLGCRGVRLPAQPAAGASRSLFVVAVRVTNGPDRGRYGWVASADVRLPNGRQVTQDRGPR